MDAVMTKEVCDVETPFEAPGRPSVLLLETTGQSSYDRGDMSQPAYLPGNEGSVEEADCWPDNADEGASDCRFDYRATMFAEFADSISITEKVFEDYDRETRREYASCEGGKPSRWLERYRECRTRCRFYRDKVTGYVHRHSNSCRNRWCEACGRVKASFIAYAATDFFVRHHRVRYLTLTQKHSDLLLKEQIEQMYARFGKLRRSRLWQDTVRGSLWCLQVKWGKYSNSWHVHIHALLIGCRVPHDQLKAKWEKITGDSIIVDIRLVRGARGLAKAIWDAVRYSGTPAYLKDVPSEHRLEIVKAFRGVRICGTTGDCDKISLSSVKCSACNADTEPIGSWTIVQRFAAVGDEDAQGIIDADRTGAPYDGPSFQEFEDFIDDKEDNKFTGVHPAVLSRAPPDIDVGFQERCLWE